MTVRGSESTDPLIGRVIDERYRVDRLVGRGGFGRVYAATHLSLRATVALKVLDVAAGEPSARNRGDSSAERGDRIGRFMDEARVLTLLRHDNLVRALDLGLLRDSEQTSPYLVMEWCEGRTLKEAMHAWGPLDVPAARAIVEALAEGLAHAHAAGVVHRDLKPSNVVMVRSADGGESPRIVDFGVAKLFEGVIEASGGKTLTLSGWSPHTPAYAAPEQVAGTRTGPWTDVHALGLILVELLTGAAPYGPEGESRARAVSPVRPSAGAGHALAPVIARALALVPAERYPDAGALCEALRAREPEPRAVAIAVPAPGKRVVRAVAAAGAAALAAGAVAGFLAVGPAEVAPSASSSREREAGAGSVSASVPSAPATCAAPLAELLRRAAEHGYRVKSSDSDRWENGSRVEVELDLRWTHRLFVETGTFSAERDRWSALYRVAEIIGTRSKEQRAVYATTAGCVIVFSGPADGDLAVIFDHMTAGEVFDVRGDTHLGPDPAKRALEPPGAGWSADRLGELSAAELESRLRAIATIRDAAHEAGESRFDVVYKGEPPYLLRFYPEGGPVRVAALREGAYALDGSRAIVATGGQRAEYLLRAALMGLFFEAGSRPE